MKNKRIKSKELAEDTIDVPASVESSDISFLPNEDLLPATPQEQTALEDILRIFLKSAHIDFSHYRQTTVLRRITRRISLNNKNNYTEYLAFLQDNPGEVDMLYDDLLLSHTEFFRDPLVFEALKQTVFPSLLSQRPVKTPLRIWVAGCSSGEEVYSLAICLHEYLTQSRSGTTAQIFGTDLNLRHITTARKGVYPDKVRKTVSPERLTRYFDQTPEGLMVTKQIREMCVFAVQDVTQDPPFPSIDLVSCRNVLIYFDTALQDIVIPLFHFALKPTGYLLLGSSESMGKYTEMFTTVNQNLNLYIKRFARSNPVYRFPVSHRTFRLQGDTPQTVSAEGSRQQGACLDITREIDSVLLASFAPPCIVVDCTMQIRQFRGDTSAYLTPAPGEASLKLSKMTREGLMPDIYVAIEEVKKRKEKVVKRNITFKQKETIATVDLSVIPIPDPSTGEQCFLIMFEKPVVVCAVTQIQPSHTDEAGAEILRLRSELQSTKEHLQAIVEEKDEVNQEMWAANEEIQSTNEELQSVNEEMEAAKEELESSNEELIALNEEMQAKNIQLRASEEKFRCLVWDMQVGVILHGPKTEILLANPKAFELLGVSEAQLLGKTSFDPTWSVIHEDGTPFPGSAHPASQAVATRSAVHNVLMGVYRPNTGDRIWLLVDAEPQLNSEQMVLQVVVTFRDITNRKQAEAALRASEMIHRSIVESSPMGMYQYVLKSDDRLVFFGANPAADRILGVDHTLFIGKTLEEAFPPLAATEVPESYRNVIKTGNQWQTEHIEYADDTIAGTFEVVAFKTGEDTMVVMFQDITERKRVEQELREQNELFSLFVSHSPVYCYIKEVNAQCSCVLQASENFEQMIGIPGSKMIGKTMEELYAPEFAAKITADDQAVIASGNVLKLDEELNGRSYTTIKFPILQGAKTLLAGYTIDITERKRAEEDNLKYLEQIQQTQKLESLGVLAGGIAHDFNNLMGGIFGYIDLANEESDAALAKTYLSKAMDTIDRARSLTAQLLTFAKGGAPIQKVCPLFPFIREAAQFALSGSNVSCWFDIQDALLLCNIDKNQISQVVDNIIINAMQAMPDGGTIEVIARNTSHIELGHSKLAPGSYVKLSFTDTGKGISKENMPRIFDPFFTTKATGHGLGLPTCYSIINRHGGCIEVESQPGKGSTFHVYLPAASGSGPHDVLQISTHTGSDTFIIMDDEMVIRETLSCILEGMGYTVAACVTGREAIDCLAAAVEKGRIVAAMILDLTVPGGMGGIATAAEIRTFNTTIPIIVASGYADDPVMKTPAEFGFTGSICKPFTKGELAECLEKHVKK